MTMIAKARYSKVARRIWNDEKFRSLSRPKPNAQTLFLRLLTGPELTNVPGLFSARKGGLADALGWSRRGLTSAFAELATIGMALADWDAGLVWVPKAIEYNHPESPNVVRSWRTAYDELPECALKVRALAHLRDFIAKLGEPFRVAFEETFRDCPVDSTPERESETSDSLASFEQRDATIAGATGEAPRPTSPDEPSIPSPSAVAQMSTPPAPSSPSLPSNAERQSVPCPADLPLTDDARASAETLGLTDVALVWTAFVGHYSSRPEHRARRYDWYGGRWQKWAAQEVQRQRVQRANGAARGNAADATKQTKLASHLKVPEPIRFPKPASFEAPPGVSP